MTIDRDLIDRLRTRGEEMFTQVSAELMQNPNFVKAMQGAVKGKERVEEVVREALKKADIPSRKEHKRAVARIDTLEAEVAELRKTVAAKAAPARKASTKAAARKKTGASRKAAKARTAAKAKAGASRAKAAGGRSPRKTS